MLKSAISVLCFISLASSHSFSQQRIGIDISSQMMNLMFTAHYQKVLKNRVLYSVGVFGGNNGKVYVEPPSNPLYSNYRAQSPYPSVNRDYADSTGNYSLVDYTTTASSIGIQAGLGYFHEFDVQHGLRINLNSSIGFAQASVSGYYRSSENFQHIFDIRSAHHWFGSVSLEAYHTIRLTGRLTFNYGLKVPYFFTIDRATFNPTNYKDLLYGFEPQLSIGMTRVIGKCD